MRKATTSDADDLVQVLARAFDDDPVINWFVRQDTGRHDAFRRFFDLAVRTMTLPRRACPRTWKRPASATARSTSATASS